MNMDKLPLRIEKCTCVIDNGTVCINSEAALLAIMQQKVMKSSKVCLWLNHKVVFGLYEDSKIIWGEAFEFSPEQLVEFRAFNSEQELLIADGSYRFIQDEAGEEVEYVDTSSRLWGWKMAAAENFTLLEDDERKLKLVIPVNGKTDYYELKLRSYIGYNDKTGQAGYTSYRYVDIIEGRE